MHGRRPNLCRLHAGVCMVAQHHEGPAVAVAQSVRQELHDHLVRINPDKKWDFITEQARLRA